MKSQSHTSKSKMLVSTALFLFVSGSAMGCATKRVVVHEPAHRTVLVMDQPGPNKVVVVTKRPPSPRREVRPRRPSSRHVWAGGYWIWRSSKYVWVSGKWVVPPRHGGRWVAGHWKTHGGGWVWVAGRWRY